LVILGERDQFEMGFAERDGQKFELLRWSEAVATVTWARDAGSVTSGDAVVARAGHLAKPRGVLEGWSGVH
jgi:hypothetical protein